MEKGKPHFNRSREPVGNKIPAISGSVSVDVIPISKSKFTQGLKIFSKLFSDKSLTKKASLNALAATLDYGSHLIVGFIITPLLVTGLGDFLYGAWRILQQFVGYIAPASGRSTQALKWTLANRQSSSDYEEKRRYVGSALVIWALFMPLMTALGGLIAWFAPVWLDMPKEFFWSVRLAAALLAAGLVITSLCEIPRSVLLGHNLGYKRMGLSATLVFVGGGFTWIALYLDTGIAGVAAAALATTLLTGILFLLIARIYTPWFGVARPSLAASRRFLGLSWWFIVWNLVMRVMKASDAVMLGVFGSVELVTTFALTKYAPETVITFVTIMVFGITPGLGGIIGSGNLQKAYRVRNEIMLFTWLIVTGLGPTVLLWNWAFIQLWVGAEHYAGTIPTLLIVILATQFVLIRNDACIIDLTLRLRRKVLMGALSIMLSLIAAGVLVSYFKMGIVGLCLGFIGGRSVLSISYPIMVGRFLKVAFSSQLKSILRPVLVTMLLFLLASKIGGLLTESIRFTAIGWTDFILSAGVTLCVVILLAFYAGLSDNQRGHVLRRIRMVVAIAPD